MEYGLGQGRVKEVGLAFVHDLGKGRVVTTKNVVFVI